MCGALFIVELDARFRNPCCDKIRVFPNSLNAMENVRAPYEISNLTGPDEK